MPLIRSSFSIVMPIHGDRDGERALRSVYFQNYPRDLVETIVIEDEDSQLTKKYPASKIIHHKERLERAISRTEGMAAATNDWVIWLDSITAERRIPVKIDGRMDVLSIEELFNLYPYSHFNGKEVCYPTDLETLSLASKQDDYWKVPAFWTKVTKIIRHRTDKNVYRVTQKYGQVEVTEDHSLVKLEGGELVKSKWYETVDNPFVTVGGVERGKLESIDLWEYLSEVSGLISDEKTVRFDNHQRGQDKIFLKRQLGGDSLLSLCRILGLYISEGSVSKRPKSKNFDIALQEKEILQGIEKDFQELTNATFSYCADKKGTYATVWRLRNYSNLLTAAFPYLCGKDSRSKKIPQFIYNLDKKYQAEFLKYLVIGDGSRKKGSAPDGGKRSKKFLKNYFVYTTVSLGLASGLCFLLRQLGIDFSVGYRESKKSWGISTRPLKTNRRGFKTFISPLEKASRYVYDLSVESDSHTFVDSLGLVALHNSDDELISSTLYNLDYWIRRCPGYKIFHYGGIVYWEPKTFDEHNYEPRTTIRPTPDIPDGEPGMGYFETGKVATGHFVFRREIFEELGGMPQQMSPYVFADECAREFPEFREMMGRRKVDTLGNPWGCDFFYFYKITRKYKSKALPLNLYLQHVRR